MNIRATPVSNNIPSPAELLMKRKITTLLPSRSEMDYNPIKQQMQNKKHQQMLQYNKNAAPNYLPPLYPGQDVWVFDKTSKTRSPATVITRCPEPRSHTVQTVRRNSPLAWMPQREQNRTRTPATGKLQEGIITPKDTQTTRQCNDTIGKLTATSTRYNTGLWQSQ